MTAFKAIMFVTNCRRRIMIMMMTVLFWFSYVGSVRCRCCDLHFPDNETEAQRGSCRSCLWIQEVAEPGFEFRQSGSKAWGLNHCLPLGGQREDTPFRQSTCPEAVAGCSLLGLLHRYSERSLTKCIGITIETRPDYCMKRHLSDMLTYGCTRLEIGVQSVYEDVARDTNR